MGAGDSQPPSMYAAQGRGLGVSFRLGFLALGGVLVPGGPEPGISGWGVARSLCFLFVAVRRL